MTDTYSNTGIRRPSIEKDPNATLDYTFDWTDWLATGSDTIGEYSITVSGVTLVTHARVGALVTIWVSGGTAGPGVFASATCHVATDTSPPREDDRTIYFRIRER